MLSKAQGVCLGLALKDLRKAIEKENLSSIALPKLATGVGGLDWNDIKPMIEKHLGDLDAKVYLYSLYKKDERANEPPLPDSFFDSNHLLEPS